DDGTFPYMPSLRNATPFTPCTTCAGLVGLAYTHAAANETAWLSYTLTKQGPQPKPGKGLRNVENDPSLRKGLAALERYLSADAARPKPGQYTWKPDSGFTYMALWSVERVGVAYDREQIGKIGWYNWGARKLVAQQLADGSWNSKPGAALSTA